MTTTQRDHHVYLTLAHNGYTWGCTCGAGSTGAWSGDPVASPRHALANARSNGHDAGGVSYIGFTPDHATARVIATPPLSTTQ
jgi:hypothetical protein